MHKIGARYTASQNVRKKNLFDKTQGILRWLTTVLAIGVFIVGTFGCSNSDSDSQKHPTNVTLKLSGNNCELYLGAVGTALETLQGVQETDLTTQKGQAIIKTDGTLKASQIVHAVDGLSGDGWTCEAELLNENPT